MMKTVLIKSFKNHPAGSTLDLSQRVFNYLLSLGCVEDPRPIEFGPDVVEAAQKLKKPSTKKKTKALDKPPADKMIREAETK